MPPKKSKKSTLPAFSAAPPEPLRDYGFKIKGKSQWWYDRAAFAWRVPIDYGAPRRLDLFKKIAAKLNPTYFGEWNSWSEKLVETCCENKWIAVAGCGSSGKSYGIAGFACAWWLCAPEVSSVILCSTTAKSLRKRAWANIQRFHTTIPGSRIGKFVDSQMIWKAQHGDDLHAIMGLAVEEGETNKVADNLKGIHTVRQMVIIDEATAVPAAIFDACTNLYSFPQQSGGEFLLVMLGNPRSRLDEFGRFMEPLKGWHSVSVDTEEWETTPKIDGTPGICIRFDAEKSPNIIEGRIVSKYLPNKERVEARKRAAGSENDPTYWSNERGFPPPEGLKKTVFSETMLDMHGAYDKQVFTGENFRIIGALDPARAGGDRAALRFAKFGEIRRGVMGIEVGPPITIKINARSTNPIDYQIAEQVERECSKVTCFGGEYVCLPENFGVDATGGGADLVDVMQRTWSSLVMRIVFSEAASEDPCSHEDVRKACDVYKNKRVEMYFRSSNAVKTGQLKGIDKETAKELTSIEYDDIGKPRITLMSKDDYRLKFGNSPDYSDCLVIGLEVARRLGFRLIAMGQTVNREERFEEQFHKAQAVFTDISYSTSEEDDYEEAYV